MIRTLTVAAATAAAALSLAACGHSGAAAPATSPSSATSTTATTTAGTPAAGTITATETEYAISMSATTTTAGSHTFSVHNAGKVTHALTVKGPGGVDATTGDIAPGNSGTVTVSLQAGTYDVYCPVADHKMLGMDTSLTVS